MINKPSWIRKRFNSETLSLFLEAILAAVVAFFLIAVGFFLLLAAVFVMVAIVFIMAALIIILGASLIVIGAVMAVVIFYPLLPLYLLYDGAPWPIFGLIVFFWALLLPAWFRSFRGFLRAVRNAARVEESQEEIEDASISY